MRKFSFILYSIVIVVLFQACNSKNRTKEIAHYQQLAETEAQLNEVLKQKVGSWIKEGAECYGIVLLNSQEGDIQAVKELKAKVLIIQGDKIKMKALEDVSVAPTKGCTKLGIAKGETWWEEEGDLFQTREEALAFIQTIKTTKQKPAGTKFTVD